MEKTYMKINSKTFHRLVWNTPKRERKKKRESTERKIQKKERKTKLEEKILKKKNERKH